MNRGRLPWLQKNPQSLGLAKRGAAFLGGEQLGTPVTRASVALWGRKLHAKYTQKSSQISFLERVSIEIGDAKLEKEEEACEILCSSTSCQAVGGLWQCSHQIPGAWGSEIPQPNLRIQ